MEKIRINLLCIKVWRIIDTKTEAAVSRCFYEKVFWKYASNLQENTHVKTWFQ